MMRDIKNLKSWSQIKDNVYRFELGQVSSCYELHIAEDGKTASLYRKYWGIPATLAVSTELVTELLLCDKSKSECLKLAAEHHAEYSKSLRENPKRYKYDENSGGVWYDGSPWYSII